jgi:hypothetical protein
MNKKDPNPVPTPCIDQSAQARTLAWLAELGIEFTPSDRSDTNRPKAETTDAA